MNLQRKCLRVKPRSKLVAVIVLGVGGALQVEAISGEIETRSVVVRPKPALQKRIDLDLPDPPGFAKGLDNYVPRSYRDRRRLQVRSARLVTMLSGRWVPDTTSFAGLIRQLNRLPEEKKGRVLPCLLLSPAAMKGYAVVSRFWRRYNVPLVEPHTTGVRLKPVGWAHLLRVWYLLQLNRRNYAYFQIPSLRTILFHSRSQTHSTRGVWVSPMPRLSVSLQCSHGRTWKASALSVQYLGTKSYAVSQIIRVSNRWRQEWRLVIRWESVW